MKQALDQGSTWHDVTFRNIGTRADAKIRLAGDLLREVAVELPVVAAGRREATGADPRLPPRRIRAARLVSHHRDTLNDPLALEVVQHEVLRAAVVPHCDRALRPPVTHRESR